MKKLCHHLPFFPFSLEEGTKSGDNTAISIPTTSFEIILFDLSFLEMKRINCVNLVKVGEKVDWTFRCQGNQLSYFLSFIFILLLVFFHPPCTCRLACTSHLPVNTVPFKLSI